MIRNAAMIGWESGDPAHRHALAFQCDHDMIVGQFPVCKRCHAQFSALARLNLNVAAAIMFQSEAYVRPRHGEATDNISESRIFRPGGAENFEAGGPFSDKLLHTRSEERRVGREGVRTCRYRGEPNHYKQKNKN